MANVGREIAATSQDLKELLRKTETRAEKERLRQLAVEYQRLLDELEVNERLVIDQCKIFVQTARHIASNPNFEVLSEAENQPLISQPLIQAQSQHQVDLRSLQHEIDYNETIIQERQEEIENIARASELVQELFHNIGVIVSEQQDLVGKDHNGKGINDSFIQIILKQTPKSLQIMQSEPQSTSQSPIIRKRGKLHGSASASCF